MFYFQSVLIFSSYIIIFHSPTIKSKENFCYFPKFLNSSWTDRRPDFKVNMTFNKQGYMTSINWIEKDILLPVAQFEILQTDCCYKTITLYNLTTRLCDIQLFITKVPMFQKTIQNALRNGNYTYECPLKRGVYVMNNVRISHRNPILSFMYRANRTFTFIGGLYEELENKSLRALSTYRFKGTIVRKLCKE